MTKDQELAQQLQELGLSKAESLVYKNLLESNGNYPSVISKQTKLKRTTVYALLDNLYIKGLVSESTQGAKKFFVPEKPEKLVVYAQMKIDMAQRAKSEAMRLVESIKKQTLEQKSDIVCLVFCGNEAVAKAYMDHVVYKNYEMRAIANVSSHYSFFTRQQWKRYILEKETQNISLRVVISDNKNGREFSADMFKGVAKKYWPQIRWINKEDFPEDIEITLYGTKSVSLLRFDGKKPYFIKIEDESIYAAFSFMFEVVWKNSNG